MACHRSLISTVLFFCLQVLADVLNTTPFSFAIDLGALASRREYLNLDKWLQDNLTVHRDTFFLVRSFCKARPGLSSYLERGFPGPVEEVGTDVDEFLFCCWSQACLKFLRDRRIADARLDSQNGSASIVEWAAPVINLSLETTAVFFKVHTFPSLVSS